VRISVSKTAIRSMKIRISPLASRVPSLLISLPLAIVSAVEAAPAARRGPRAEHCTRFCPAKGLARLFTNLCDQDHRPAAKFCAILRESFVGERMEKPSLLTAVGKLAIAGEQAGFSIEQMIELLNEGLSVETLLDLISWRLQTIQEEATAPPACSSGWIVSKCQQLSN
jgi:hypothetical protein